MKTNLFRDQHRLKTQKLFFLLFFLCWGNLIKAQTPQTVTIGNTAGAASWFYGPIMRSSSNANTLNYSRHAYIYTASELGIPSGARIVKLEWLKKDGGTIVAPNTFEVYMSNTSITSFPATAQWSTLVNGATQTYANSFFPVTIGNNAYLSAPFNIPGSDSFIYSGSNLQILTDWFKGGFQTGNGIAFYTYSTGSAGKAIGIASTNPITGSTPLLQAATYGNQRPTIRITYVPTPQCSGIPEIGTIVTTDSVPCGGSQFTLSTEFQPSGSGITYLWEKSTDNFVSNVTSNLGTSSILSVNQSQSFWYRCIATCVLSGSADTATRLIQNNSCYCSSSAISNGSEDIVQVTFGTGQLNNTSLCGVVAPGPGSIASIYSNYTTLTPSNYERGSSVPFSISIKDCNNGSYGNHITIFIDYNGDQDFLDPGEIVFQTTSPSVGNNTKSGIIQIPGTASVGTTRMRVICIEQNPIISNPCITNYNWGETEDYLINITPATTCSGTPNPGTTIASTNPVCYGLTTILTPQNLTPGNGITYQWYKDGISIVGATNISYTTQPIVSGANFHCAVTCTNSGITTNTTAIAITLNNFSNCYCASFASDPADDEIFSVTMNSVLYSANCNTVAPGSSILNQYSDFTSFGAVFGNFTQSQTISFGIEVDDCDQSPYYSFGVAIWIDYNHNSTFESTERVFVEPVAIAGPRLVTGSFIVPCTSLTGLTRMRILEVEGAAGSNISACGGYGYGETEDYLVNIVQPSVCTTPVPGSTTANISTFCTSATVNLSLSNTCMFSNLYTFQWYKDNVLISGATNNTYSTTISNTAEFRCDVTCSGTTVASTPVTVTKSDATMSVTPASATYCSTGFPVTLTVTGVVSSTINPIGTPNGSNWNVTPSTPTTYTVTGTNANGCTVTSTAIISVCNQTLLLNIKCFIEGYYIGAGLMTPVLQNQVVAGATGTMCDSIDVKLHSSLNYNLVTTKRVLLNTNGTASVSFVGTPPGSYYIAIKHRNAVETWSANPVAISATLVTYDFTTAANKAYGSNQINLGSSVFGFYSGDVNQNENIELSDDASIEFDANEFLSGYLATDLNGDGNVDLLEKAILEPNINNFIFSSHP